MVASSMGLTATHSVTVAVVTSMRALDLSKSEVSAVGVFGAMFSLTDVSITILEGMG